MSDALAMFRNRLGPDLSALGKDGHDLDIYLHSLSAKTMIHANTSPSPAEKHLQHEYVSTPP